MLSGLAHVARPTENEGVKNMKIQVSTSNEKESTLLSIANMIAVSHDGGSTQGQRYAFCLALYAAGAPVQLYNETRCHLLSIAQDLAKNCNHNQLRYLIERSCAEATDRYDTNYDDFPGLFYMTVVNGKARFFPSLKTMPEDEALRSVLIRAFVEAMNADDTYELPTFQLTTTSSTAIRRETI